MAGGPRATRGRAPFYNSAFLLTPDGDIVAAQDKRFLIPFAEYFPFGGVELLRRRFGRVDALTPGVLTAPLPTEAGPAGALVAPASVGLNSELPSDVLRCAWAWAVAAPKGSRAARAAVTQVLGNGFIEFFLSL